MPENELEKLLEQLRNELPQEMWKPWLGGRKNMIEAALIDTVLSIQANYGSEYNGVRGAVRRYTTHVGDTSPNELQRLANMNVNELQDVLNDQKVSGRSKASAIKEAADNLVGVGVNAAADLDAENRDHKRAYMRVHGLGVVTWVYFGMLLGKSGVKADTWICRFVRRATGRKVSPQETNCLVMAAAEGIGKDPTHLDHAIWAYERKRRTK